MGGEGKREAAEAVALDEARSALAKSMAAQAKELAARLMESGRRCRAIDALKGYLTRKARETAMWNACCTTPRSRATSA